MIQFYTVCDKEKSYQAEKHFTLVSFGVHDCFQKVGKSKCQDFCSTKNGAREHSRPPVFVPLRHGDGHEHGAQQA